MWTYSLAFHGKIQKNINEILSEQIHSYRIEEFIQGKRMYLKHKSKSTHFNLQCISRSNHKMLIPLVNLWYQSIHHQKGIKQRLQ